MSETKENKSIQYLLIGGIITLIINLLVSFFQEKKKIELEQIQFESTLIINAIDKNDSELSKKNIKFLIESGIISENNRKILPLITDTTFSIKLTKVDTIQIEPQNPSEIGNSFLQHVYSAQILDENNIPLEGVEIVSNTYPSARGSFYAKTKSDKNGLFKIPLPEGDDYTLSIQKEGYIGRNGIHDSDMNPPEKIKLYKKKGFFKDMFH
jgi:hypothetical protein